jgi:FkbM family methyltransferase
MAQFVPQIINSLEVAYKHRNQIQAFEALRALWEPIFSGIESQNSLSKKYLNLNTYSDNLPSSKYNYPGKDGINFIDVGSAGCLPSPWNENKHRIANFLKFEPRSHSNLDTKDTDKPTISVDVALWRESCERNFYIYQGFGGSGSSFFLPNHEYVLENFEVLKNRGPATLASTWLKRSKLDRVEKIHCYKLDEVLENLNQPFPYHFLKIDAQGAEYEILKGAEKFLENQCVGLHLELFVFPLYKDIKLLPEVVDYLKKFEFQLVKKYPAHGSFDSQHDCLFIKKGSHEVVSLLETVYQIENINSVTPSDSVTF